MSWLLSSIRYWRLESQLKAPLSIVVSWLYERVRSIKTVWLINVSGAIPVIDILERLQDTLVLGHPILAILLLSRYNQKLDDQKSHQRTRKESNNVFFISLFAIE